MERPLNIPAPFDSLGDNRINIAALVEQLQTGGVIPFVGAGMSVPFGFPDWKSFLMSMALDDSDKRLIEERLAKGEYEEAAEYLLQSRGSNAFQAAIDFTFGPEKLGLLPESAAIRLLPALCSGPVLTTNFDSVLEKVFKAEGKDFDPIILGMKLDHLREAFHQRSHALIHLHGEATDRADRVLTLSDYRKKYRNTSPLKAVLRLAMTQPLLFLGCSLNNDRPVLALKKLAAELRKNKAEALMAHYAVLEFPSDAEEYRSRLSALAGMCVRPIWYPTGEHDRIRELLELLVKQAGKQALGRPGVPHIFPHLTTGVETCRGFTSLEQFLALYLGSPGGEKPLFVGRESQLKELDSWLERPGEPYALLVGPAGRGKSALVTRWARGVAESGRAQVAFVPVSLRFNTASAQQAFEILGHRLRFLRARYSATPPDAGAWAREIEAELRTPNSDKPLLVLLDGVDEANGWTCGEDLLFPPQPGQAVKVLVTARLLSDRDESGWLRLLKWDRRALRIRMPLLRREHLQEAIHAVLPEQADNPVVIDQLWGLTQEGDPLLLKLYIDGLVTGDINIGSLSQIAPGLEGYFEEWWEQQQKLWGQASPLDKPAVIRTLCALSCAQGPITSKELVAVLEPETQPREIEKALPALARFVTRTVASGSEPAGYVFQHPRLNEFFHERYVISEREWHAQFARCGSAQHERLRRGEIAPKDFSPYFLQHYGHHLEQAGAKVDELAVLVGKTWLEAWQSSKSTELGFLLDTERVRRIARRGNEQEVARSGRAPYLHYEAKCALIRASLASLSRGTPPELLRVLLDKNIWDTDQALVDVRQGPVPLNRILALAVIAPRLDAPEAIDLLDEAAAIARGLEGRERSEAFKAVCLACIAAGDFHRAAQAQRVVEDQRWRKELLVENAERFASAIDTELLFGAIEGLEAEHSLDVLLALVSRFEGEVRKNFIERAKSAADSLLEPDRAIALLRLARLAPEHRATLIKQALDLAEEIAQWGLAEEYCSRIFDELPASLNDDLRDQAFSIADCAEQNGATNALVLAELVKFYPSGEQHEARRAVLAKLLSNGSLYTIAGQDLLPRWVADLYEDEAASLLESFPDYSYFATIILKLADRVSDDRFEAALREILLAVLSKDYVDYYWWEKIVLGMPEKSWSIALDVMDHIANDDELPLTKPAGVSARGEIRERMSAGDKRNKLCGFLKAVATDISSDCLEAAAAFARSAPDTKERCAALTALIPRLAGNVQLGAIRDALADANEAWLAAELRQELLTNLPEELPLDLQKTAVQLVSKQFGEKRATAIAALAPKIDPSLLGDLRRLAREIDDRYAKTECAIALAPLATSQTASQWIEILVREGYYSEAVPLISHVPPEDFPRLLQLQEKISDPDASAEYISAFAPRLDGELIREAIRRLEGLTFDWHMLRKRHYLSPLALRAVQLGLVSEAIESIERWPDAKGKAHALSTIGSQLPVETFEWVERIARGITNSYYRCEALCAIAPLAPGPRALRAEILQEAEKDNSITLMVLATEWEDDFRRESLWERATEKWRWFHLSDSEHLSRALKLSAPEQRESAISLLLQHCESLSDKESYLYRDLLNVLVDYCSKDQLVRIAALANRLHNVHDWARIVAPLLECASPSQRSNLNDIARRRDDPATEMIADVILARFETEAERRKVIEKALQGVRQNETWLLRYVAPLLTLQPTEECYRYCSELLASFATQGREALLKRMTELAPVIGHLQSREDVSNILNAIQEVSDWWP
jgi:hypothetical protein